MRGKLVKMKSVFNIYMRGCFLLLPAVALIFMMMNVNAQTLYRWKDENGATHISDQPPPPSCMSSDCRAYRDKMDRELMQAKRAAEEKAKEEQKKREDSAKFKAKSDARLALYVAQTKSELRECIASKRDCTLSTIKSSIKTIGTLEKGQGIIETLGPPHNQQLFSDDTTYWYYHLGRNTVQIQWTNIRSGHYLKSVSIY